MLQYEEYESLLELIEQNDPAVDKLAISHYLIEGYSLVSPDCPDHFFARLGAAIGGNTRLTSFHINWNWGRITSNAPFVEGVRQNNSIKTFGLRQCSNFADEGLRKLLLNCNFNLKRLSLKGCTIDNEGEGTQFLSSVIRNCTELRGLRMTTTAGTRQHLPALAVAIRACPCLISLRLDGNNIAEEFIGREEFELMAPLLQDPTSKLRSLTLGISSVGSDCTNIFARALVGNNKLEKLVILGNGEDNLSLGDFDSTPFKTLLCDTTTMNATYFSNHTLEHIWTSAEKTSPEELMPFLTLNRRSRDKKEVAVLKTFQFHPQFDVVSLFEWDMKPLPVLVEWFDRVTHFPLVGGELADKHKLCAIFQFIRAMPDVFAPPAQQKKRKHNEVDV